MYAKIFSQIYDGTLCTNGPWEALVTFQQMLILADQDGSVDMTLPAIARRTTIPKDILERGINALMQADPESRTPTEEGRRLVPLAEGRSWGWRVVNYVMYRQIKREEDRREYHREYWHKRKAKDSTTPPVTTDSTRTQQPQPNQPIAYTEAEAEVKKNTCAPKAAPDPEGFEEFWNTWPKTERKVARKQCAEKWKKKGLSVKTEEILAHVASMKTTKQWLDGFEPAPLTYINGERWLDGVIETSEIAGVIL